MSEYRISGIWKDTNDEITHYAIHKVESKKVFKASKITKKEVISLLENDSNFAYTWVWNYKMAKWIKEQKIDVIQGENEKYLRSDPDKKITNNLGHLIDYDWVY